MKVLLSTPLDAKLGYRKGCFADKQFSHFTAVDKEQQLEDALMLEDPNTDLSFAMEIDSFNSIALSTFHPKSSFWRAPVCLVPSPSSDTFAHRLLQPRR